MCDEHVNLYRVCNRRQNPESRIRSPCDDPAYSQWFSLWWPGTLPTSPKSSRIQNSESEDRLPAHSSAWICDDPTYRPAVQNSESRCSLLPCAVFVKNSTRGGRIQKLTIRKGSLRRKWWTGSESRIARIMRGGGLSRESRVQSLDKGVRDFAENRREFRIQS